MNINIGTKIKTTTNIRNSFHELIPKGTDGYYVCQDSNHMHMIRFDSDKQKHCGFTYAWLPKSKFTIVDEKCT